jgi:hypothetical protein
MSHTSFQEPLRGEYVIGGRVRQYVGLRALDIGTREEHNPYTAELAAIAHGLGCLPEIKYQVIMILTSNRSAAQAIS